MVTEVPSGEGFKAEYKRKGSPLTIDSLLEIVNTKGKEFPDINGRLDLHGRLGETGLVITNGGGGIVAAVKHPRHIPDHKIGNEIIFGGAQCDNHLELSIERPANGSVQSQALMITEALKHGKIKEIAEIYSGLAAIGSEPEAWVVSLDGSLAQISAGELQLGLNEDSQEPMADPGEFLRERALYIVERQKRYPGLAIIDTSVLPTSNPLEMRINGQGEYGPYVEAVQTRLSKDFFRYSDPLAEQLMDQMARTVEAKNHAELREVKGDMAYWAMAASHASVGLVHRRTGRAALWIPEQDAVAVADIFNTNLATTAEFLMMSTPVVYGQTPKVMIDGQEYWPRDYRAILRYLMDTTSPSDFIMTPERMHERITQLVVGGYTHTIDRASYIAQMPDGRIVPVMHGRVRNRMASSEPKNQTGRVEFTGCSASPSLYDELARNCLLQVLTFAAYEALANDQHPVNYFKNKYGERFSDLGRWQEQKELLTQASLFGFNHQPVRKLIFETIDFMNLMVNKYPNLKDQVDIVNWRLGNLMQKAALTLEEYLQTGQGSITEVLQNELKSGVTPVDLVQKINHFELAQAQKILDNSKS